MPKLATACALACAIAATAPAASQDATAAPAAGTPATLKALLLDFDHGDTGVSPALYADDSGTLFKLDAAPKPRGRSAHFAWKANHSTAMSVQWDEPVALPALDQPGFHKSASVAVWCKDPSILSRFGFQAIDSAGVTWQWQIPATQALPGTWTTLIFDLDAANVTGGHWGGGSSASDKPVPPMKLHAIAFDFPTKDEAGEIWIDDIAMAAPAAK
jgi:hypothetical protein